MHVVDAVDGGLIDDLVDLYRSTWWAAERRRADVERMLAVSPVVVGVVDGDRLVGFSRALTDGVFIALVLDVIVAEDRRGDGVGAMVLDALLDRLGDVERIELVCRPDVDGFYARWGFTDDVGGSHLLRRTR